MTSGGTRSVDLAAVSRLEVPSWAPEYVDQLEQAEAARIETSSASHPGFSDLRGWTVIIVDDGLSSGDQLVAAAAEAMAQVPRNVIVASPVLATPVAARLLSLGADVEWLFADDFERPGAGPSWYAEAGVPGAAEIRRILGSARRRAHWRDEVEAG